VVSSLTSTNIKSGFLYLFLLATISVGVLYLILFDKKTTFNNLQKKTLLITASAFKNGIKFANIKFNLNQNNNNLNLWNTNNVGLDFNYHGFPIGTNILNNEQLVPASSEQCRQIWQFVLGPLQPALELSFNNSGYWVKLNTNGSCSYRYSQYRPHINYQPLTGKISLLEQ